MSDPFWWAMRATLGVLSAVTLVALAWFLVSLCVAVFLNVYESIRHRDSG